MGKGKVVVVGRGCYSWRGAGVGSIKKLHEAYSNLVPCPFKRGKFIPYRIKLATSLMFYQYFFYQCVWRRRDTMEGKYVVCRCTVNNRKS
jgi:hypothetical protein